MKTKYMKDLAQSKAYLKQFILKADYSFSKLYLFLWEKLKQTYSGKRNNY